MTPPPRLVPDRPSDASVASERDALIATLRTMLKSSEPQTDAETGEDDTVLPMPVESFDRTMRIAIRHLETIDPPAENKMGNYLVSHDDLGNKFYSTPNKEASSRRPDCRWPHCVDCDFPGTACGPENTDSGPENE